MIISTISESGGVGKTTITLNLAHVLGSKGYQVLVVDLDPNESTKEFIGHEGTITTENSSASLFSENPALHIVRAWETIDVSLSCPQMRDILSSLSGRAGFQYLLADALQICATDYDFILIDPPGTAGIAQMNAAFAADQILVPTVLEVKVNTITSLVARVAKDFASAREGRTPAFMGVQPNMYDKDSSTHNYYLDALKNGLEITTLEPIKHFKAIATASSNGLPLARKGHPGLEAFSKLADFVISRQGVSDAKAA